MITIIKHVSVHYMTGFVKSIYIASLAVREVDVVTGKRITACSPVMSPLITVTEQSTTSSRSLDYILCIVLLPSLTE